MPKRTFQPHKKKAKRKHGFLERMSSTGGKNILKRRRRKKRSKMTTV